MPDADPARPATFSDSSVPPAADRFAPTAGARIVLADDNADMRAYVYDLLSPSKKLLS